MIKKITIPYFPRGMAGIILEGKKPVVPVDGEEGVKDMKILDAIVQAVKSGKKVDLKL